MALSVEIEEQPIRIVMESDFWGIILTVALISATLLVAGITFWYNRKTHNVLKTELESKIKPNLLFDNYSWRVGKNKEIGIWAQIQNLGTVSARNVKVYNYLKPTEFKLNELISNEVENHKIKSDYFELNTILPNFIINYNSSKNVAHSTGEHYITIWLEYDYLNDKHEEIIHIFKFRTNISYSYPFGAPPKTRLIRSYDDQDIQDARKRWKDEKSGNISAPN